MAIINTAEGVYLSIYVCVYVCMCVCLCVSVDRCVGVRNSTQLKLNLNLT